MPAIACTLSLEPPSERQMITEATNKIQIPSTLEELPSHPNLGFRRFMRAVGEGRLQPGATFTQAQICDLLDVSLSPLRETLVLLEEYGLIDIKPRSGISIVNPELSFVRENYQFRVMIEIEALTRFLDDVPAGWVAAVRTRQQELLREIEGGNQEEGSLEAFVALDYFMHSSFVAALKNKSIAATHRRLQENIRMIRAIHRTAAYRKNILHAGQEHLDLLDQIEARSVERSL